MTPTLTDNPARDRYLALALSQREQPCSAAGAQELASLWEQLDAPARAQVQAWLRTIPLPAETFVSPDPDLNVLLEATQRLTADAHAPSTMAWQEALERVLDKLPLEAPAFGRPFPTPALWVASLPSAEGASMPSLGAVLAWATERCALPPLPGARVFPLYTGYPRRFRPASEELTYRACVGLAFSPCPFCNHTPGNTEDDLIDSLHPVGRSSRVWSFSCLEHAGGCGAGVLGDSPEDCRQRWNARAGYAKPPVVDLVAHLERQAVFSEQTFGPSQRTAGVVAHIRKELIEIEDHPTDLFEWIDVVLLAFDGARRAGHDAVAIAQALLAKLARNEARDWPDWRTAPTDGPIEHIEPGRAPASSPPSTKDTP